MSGSCMLETVVLPIKDVQVNSTVPDSLMKGIPAKVGSPEQDVLFLPWPELNNTWIYDKEAFCDPTIIFSDEICFVRRGGYYLESESDSFKQALDVVDAGGATLETAVEGSEVGIENLISSSLGGTDTLEFATDEPLEAFPIGIPRQRWDRGYTSLHALGVGSNSTYLRALVDANRIAAKVWSIFWGRMWGANSLMDGSIVFGGYDRAKVIGRNLTQNLDFGSAGCWTGMRLNIRDIRVNPRSGSDKSLFPPNTVLPVCLVPQRQLLLEAPADIYTNFENATLTSNIGLSFGLHWGAHLFDTGTEFDGDITFELDSGLAIRVPNDQYVVPFVTIDRNNSRIFNESQREVLIASLADQPATLGRYFLTAAYLMVNQDAGTFSIWQANPSKSTDIVAMTNKSSATRCDNSASPAPSLSPEESKISRMSDGALAGVIVGVIVFVIMLGLGVFFSLQRRKRHTRPVSPPGEILGPKEMHGTPSQMQVAPLIPSDCAPEFCGPLEELHIPRQELEGWGNPEIMHEIDGPEQPAEAP